MRFDSTLNHHNIPFEYTLSLASSLSYLLCSYQWHGFVIRNWQWAITGKCLSYFFGCTFNIHIQYFQIFVGLSVCCFYFTSNNSYLRKSPNRSMDFSLISFCNIFLLFICTFYKYENFVRYVVDCCNRFKVVSLLNAILLYVQFVVICFVQMDIFFYLNALSCG